jgi:hypothetical protein
MPKTKGPLKTAVIAFRLPEKPFRRLKARAERLGLGVNETACNKLVELLAEEDTNQPTPVGANAA